jgi:hypothetical protein
MGASEVLLNNSKPALHYLPKKLCFCHSHITEQGLLAGLWATLAVVL